MTKKIADNEQMIAYLEILNERPHWAEFVARIESDALIMSELVEALTLLLDAYGEAHAMYDLGDCEGSVKARAVLAKAAELKGGGK